MTIEEQPKTREELYEKIKSSSKEEFILNDMIRLGFWPQSGVIPQDPADDIKKTAELRKELQDLRQQHSNLHNQEYLIKKLREERLLESKKKQKETKERREKEKIERSENWKQKKETDITFLGEGYSTQLNNKESNIEKLKVHNLKEYSDILSLSKDMGVSVGQLRFFAFSRKVSKVSHYRRFAIPKKSGGNRIISAPMPKLKNLQYWILENILNKVQLENEAHGFVSGKSIKTNAIQHLNPEVIVNIDLKDFFPSISYKRVKGIFASLGYSQQISTIFALICTEPTLEEVELDNQKYYVQTSERFLPQGAPTSPALTNILCRSLDVCLKSLADENGFTYTRYADDLTFSCKDQENSKNIGKIITNVSKIVENAGLKVNDKKTHVSRKNSKQEVTGIVVNKKLNVDKDTLKKLRATLHNIEQNGLENAKWNNSKDVLYSLVGYVNFVIQVNPVKGELFKAQLSGIIRKYDWKPTKKIYNKVVIENNFPILEETIIKDSKEDKTPKEKKWWNIF